MQSGQCLTIGVWRGMCNASQFLNLYLGELKGNGVQSYRRVFPRAKYQSAKASASRLLWKPGVQQMLKRKLENFAAVTRLRTFIKAIECAAVVYGGHEQRR